MHFSHSYAAFEERDTAFKLCLLWGKKNSQLSFISAISFYHLCCASLLNSDIYV